MADLILTNQEGGAITLGTPETVQLVLSPSTQPSIVLSGGLRGATGAAGADGAPGANGADGPSDHTLLTNIGTNTHAQIDTAITASTAHIADTANPHAVTKAQVGLSNVDNTTDASKPISTATQTALDGKSSLTAANTHTAGTKNTFSQSATTAGLNVGAVAGDPSSPAVGDIWFHSTQGCKYYTGATRVIVARDTNDTLTNKTINLTSNTLTGTTAQFNTALSDGDFATLAGTETFTNKRVTPRVGTTTSSATPTINTDNYDYYSLTAQAVDITSFTTNLSGTPTNGQKLWISITGTAARAITWGASFEASTVALPTTTVTTNRLDVGFIWNTATSKWRCVGAV